MNPKTLAPVKKNPPEPPKPEDFSSHRIVLFQDLLCNTVAERDSLSNVFDLWDSIPRYVVSRQQQDKWRKAGDFPQLHNVLFHYRGRELKATIQPAWIAPCFQRSANRLSTRRPLSRSKSAAVVVK